ncbi:MAG: carbohydrate porin [Pseudomonadota bacterium]|nr:carbohydrate porin [Pseudomonadota bacterium]
MQHIVYVSGMYGILVPAAQREFAHVTPRPSLNWSGAFRRISTFLTRLMLQHPGLQHVAMLALVATALLGSTFPFAALAGQAQASAVATSDTKNLPGAPASTVSPASDQPQRVLLAANADPVTVANAVVPKDEAASIEQWAVHGQVSNISQKHSRFNAAYSGANSLSPQGRTEETTDITLFAGVRLWKGAEFWFNPEIDQGFGFNNTVGAAGFPNGGAYKLGANVPYLRIPRAFVRQTISLGGETQTLEPVANQLGGSRLANNVTLTLGKFAVTDIFDTNLYAHDPRADFLNWAMVDSGPFDYAADSWGYSYGGAAEWTQNQFTLRGGVFELSEIPNGKITGVRFNQNSLTAELEMRHETSGHPGKFKLLAFRNHGRMGSYREAIQFGTANGSLPSTADVRRVSSHSGIVLNLEQELSSDVGAFARFGINGGDKEAYEFADINKSVSGGLSIKGNRWGRREDTVGFGIVVNSVSGSARDYLAAGGLGILVGDGALRYDREKIFETYYAWHPVNHLALTLDYQRIVNPAYNRDRGPVNFVALRAHAEF